MKVNMYGIVYIGVSTYHMWTARPDQLPRVLRHQPVQGPLSQHVCREPRTFPGPAGWGYLPGEVHLVPSARSTLQQVSRTLCWSHTTQSAPHCLWRTGCCVNKILVKLLYKHCTYWLYVLKNWLWFEHFLGWFPSWKFWNELFYFYYHFT